MDSLGMYIIIFVYLVIPGLVVGSALLFAALWMRGKAIGKRMTLINATLLVVTMLVIAVYRWLGVLGVFVLFDEFLVYLAWAAAAALFLAFILVNLLPGRAYIFNHLVTALLFAFALNYFVDPPMAFISDSFKYQENRNSWDIYHAEGLSAFDAQFKGKTQQEKYSLYSVAIMDKTAPKEIYSYFIGQLGSPLKDDQGSLDYVAHKSNYYQIPFFDAIHQKNLTALQVFIDEFKTASPEELKHYQDIVYAAPPSWLGLEETFARKGNPLYQKPRESDDDLKLADLILSAFPLLALTKEDKRPIIDISIENADLRAMQLFAKYSQPSGETLTAASYVLAGETDKLVKLLKTQPSLLNHQMTIGKLYPGGTNLLSYIVMFGNQNTLQAVLPMINWQDENLYYSRGYSLILAHAAGRVAGVLRGGSDEKSEDAVSAFALFLNKLLEEKITVSDEQLWNIVTNDFYINNGRDKRNVFNREAIKTICDSSAGAQFLTYVNHLDKNYTNERIKLSVAEITKVCGG